MKPLIYRMLPVVVLLTLSGCSVGTYDGLTAEQWASRANSCEDDLSGYRTALEEANSNIEDANQTIENARMYSGEDYGDMEDALGGLETVDTVSDPY